MTDSSLPTCFEASHCSIIHSIRFKNNSIRISFLVHKTVPCLVSIHCTAVLVYFSYFPFGQRHGYKKYFTFLLTVRKTTAQVNNWKCHMVNVSPGSREVERTRSAQSQTSLHVGSPQEHMGQTWEILQFLKKVWKSRFLCKIACSFLTEST